jgi:hypothetical protein
MKWYDEERFQDFFALDAEARQAKATKVVLMTVLWFLPFGIVLGNMWVFYVLYEGAGLWMTASLTAIYLMAMVLYVETTLSGRRAQREVRHVLTVLAMTSLFSLLLLLGLVQL